MVFTLWLLWHIAPTHRCHFGADNIIIKRQYLLPIPTLAHRNFCQLYYKCKSRSCPEFLFARTLQILKFGIFCNMFYFQIQTWNFDFWGRKKIFCVENNDRKRVWSWTEGKVEGGMWEIFKSLLFLPARREIPSIPWRKMASCRWRSLSVRKLWAME